VPLFCPTSQSNFGIAEVKQAVGAGPQFGILEPSDFNEFPTVHGVVFDHGAFLTGREQRGRGCAVTLTPFRSRNKQSSYRCRKSV
jgi:hypothetical protein